MFLACEQSLLFDELHISWVSLECQMLAVKWSEVARGNAWVSVKARGKPKLEGLLAGYRFLGAIFACMSPATALSYTSGEPLSLYFVNCQKTCFYSQY